MSQDFVIDAVTGEVIPAPGPHQFIRVLNYHHTTTSNGGSVTWLSGETTVARDHLRIGRVVKAEDSSSGVFDCLPGQALNKTVSIAGALGGCGKYTILGGV